MNEHLIRSGTELGSREGDEIARLPVMNTWMRTKSAITMQLSNGTLQINLFSVSIHSSQGILLVIDVGSLQADPLPADGRRHLHR